MDEGDNAWAVARFAPKQLATGTTHYEVVAALDVTDIRSIVRKNFGVALAALLVSALASVAWGARLASVMSRALARVNDALKKLEKQEYVKVDIFKTGDELENLAEGFNQMVDGLQERDKLRSTFGKYMTEAVMEHLMAGKVQLGGETLKVTILFTDIRSFTSISEKMEAHALVALLNEYFTDMVTVIIKEDGVVDKYIGDAIMAVFGAPVQRKDDPLRAVRAAVYMRMGLKKLNQRLVARGVPAIRTGIGIHTGDVVAGNIGSEQRMEYTVIGDAVNLASRLESNTKEVGADILISEDTYEAVKDHVEVRKVRELTVKGRIQPVMTYEVLGMKGGPMLKSPEGESLVPPADTAPAEAS
jgi:adenylate cyclase